MSKRPVTLKNVADKAGCSTAVVSTVLNGSKGNTVVSEATRERVLKVAGQLGYRPNTGAQMLRRNRSFQVGVLLKNTPEDRYNDPAILDYLLGINEGLQRADYIMNLVRVDDLGRESTLDARVFRELMLDGMIVVGFVPEGCQEAIVSLMKNCIWLDTSVWDKNSCIRRDERGAAKIAVRKLVAAGYKKVIYLAIPDRDELDRTQTHYSHADRMSGVRAGGKDAGIELEVVHVPWAVSGVGFPDLKDKLGKDTALLAYNVSLARRFINYAAMQGLCAVRDFGLACCDSSLDVDANFPGLARVSFGRCDMGRRAAEMIISAIDGASPESEVWDGSWIKGETVR
ncbi:MAG: LacI family DNA-binding transcriptional regulator [Planctomycetes bacterium]|nr:LacI family DNA-binding transcriptional regulator [Planctomycetota bacterium]